MSWRVYVRLWCTSAQRTTEKEIDQSAREPWPRPARHQSACYTCNYTHSAGGNIWADTARQTDPTMHRCICEHRHTHTHTHGSERNMSFSNAFTWALFALVNVNISTIFTPASILPGWMCSATDPDASTIEMTWIFFFPPEKNKPYLNIRRRGGITIFGRCRGVLFPKISSLEDLTLSLVLLDA